MATIVKVRAVWNGFTGAPGYTNWYGLSDGDAAAAANALGPRMRSFFGAIQGILPSVVQIQVQPGYQVIDTNTGHITSEGVLSATPTLVTGTGSGLYAAPAGACITWRTGHFNENGHRQDGRTYIVPLNGAAYEGNGTLTSTALNSLTSAAGSALGGTGSLVVYSRPPGGPGSLGEANIVVSALINDRVSVLRSRRD